ncbi:MAG: AgmX/PglI C-terminal domain-containing protein [Oligoflexia bacterium]|nr:AgmX/PglI C-terminal domain-containing protein [Oligoflexia bacterium]
MDDKQIGQKSQEQSIEVGVSDWVLVFNVIVGVGKEESKKTYKVNKKRVVIGSALSSDIRIQQNAVSNVHAVVEMDETGLVQVYDMASETGVFLNDRKTLVSELKDGDELKVGFATITFKKVPMQEAQKQIPKEIVKTSSSGRKLFFDAQEDFKPLILEDERNVIQIFDYPSAGEQALQVVMHWGDVILDVKHFVDKEDVTLGEGQKATFLVPGMHSDFSFVSFSNGVTLHCTGDMTGVIRTGKRVIPIEDYGSNTIALQQNDLAKITFRGITFFVSFTPVPPHLKPQRILERDPFYFKIWITSLLMTAAIVSLLSVVQPAEELETEELPPRVANIIFKPVTPPPPVKQPPQPKPPEPKVEPEKKPPPPPPPPKKLPPPPKELPKEVKPAVKPQPVKTKPTEKPVQAVNQVKGKPAKAAGGDEGEGARAKGTEGRKGEPNKPKAARGMYASKGSPSAPTNAKSAVQGSGNVEALFSDIGGNINKNLAAAGKGASSAGQRLRGYGAFTTEGNGGLGNLGSGTGGGGTSATVEGLGTKGIGDGEKGSGVGAIGSGGNLAGTGVGGGRPNVEVGNASETIIMGGLDKGLIDEIIRRHMPQIRYCYVKELNSSPNLKGRILTQFVISGSGRVSVAGVKSSDIGNANVERCLTGILKKIVFPEPVGGGIVEVSYPFSFTPSVAGN